MKKLSLTVLAVSSLAASSAFAADLALPFKAPPLLVDVWTGWYVGGNLGGSFGKANDYSTRGATAEPLFSTTSSLDGVIGGAQGGYN